MKTLSGRAALITGSGVEGQARLLCVKSGLLGLTRCVALGVATQGVTCTMISPTWVETELRHRNLAQVAERKGKGRTASELMRDIEYLNPQKRIIQPGEIEALAPFLCSNGARDVTAEKIQITGAAHW